MYSDTASQTYKCRPMSVLVYMVKGSHHSEASKQKLSDANTKYHVSPGDTFNDWTVLRRGESIHNQVRWVCQCSCGAEKQVAQGHLVKGNSKSCTDCSAQKFSQTFDRNQYARGGRRIQWIDRKMQELFTSQNGICPICTKPLPDNLSQCAWDHDHATGEGRGLLHPGCNNFIGFLENNPGVTERIAEYLHA